MADIAASTSDVDRTRQVDESRGETRAGDDGLAQVAQAGSIQLAQAAGGAEAIGSVSKASGAVFVSRASGAREQLAEGDAVFQGDRVETGGDAALGLVFVDGTTFELGAGAEMVLDELIYDPGGGAGSFISSVVTGTFVFVSGAVAVTAPEAMKVNTPAGTIGVRGTVIACSGDDAAEVCSKVSQEGGFRFFNNDDSVVVDEQFGTVFSTGLSGPLAASVLGPADMARLYGSLVQAYIQETELPQETEAGPIVLSAGGVFIEATLIDLLLLLKSSGVLGGVDSTAKAGLEVVDNDIFFVAPTIGSAITVEEESGDGSVITGLLANLPDGASVKLLGLTVTANGTLNSLTAGGETVLFDISDDGQTLIGFLPPEGEGGEPRIVFTLQFEDTPLGAFTFTLERPLDHMDSNATGSSDTIELTLQVLVSDPDPDPAAAGSIEGGVLNLTAQIVVVVNDSGPSAVDDSTVVTEERGDLIPEEGADPTIFGNVLANDSQGPDGPPPGGALVSFAYSGGTAAAGSTVTTNNGGLLTVNADGSWSYLPPVNVDADLDDGFTYTIQDFDGDSSSARQSIIVTDDPTTGATSASFTSADLESKLPGGSDEDPDGVVAVIGDLTIDFGKDQGSVEISDIDLQVLDQNGGIIPLSELSSGGTSLTFEETTGTFEETSGSRTFTAFFADGPRAGEKIFELTVDQDGDSSVVGEEGILTSIDGPFFRFELFAPLDHTVVGAVGSDDTLTLVFSYTASAGGDSATGTISITLLDDGPAVIANEDSGVQESALAPGSGADLDGTTEASGVLGFAGGADTARITAVSVDGLAGVLDASTGEIVVNGGFYLLRVDIETGAYSYALTGPAPHLSGATPTDSLVQTVSYSVTDGDQDPIVGSLLITIEDDEPLAFDDGDVVQEGAGSSVSGNVIAGDSQNGIGGADTQGADGVVVAGVQAGQNDTPLQAAGTVGTAVAGAFGTLTVFANGSYSYLVTADSVPPGATEVFSYTIRDADGDLSVAQVTIGFTDANIPITPDSAATVFESAMDDQATGLDLLASNVTGSMPALTSETTSGDLGFTSSDPVVAVSAFSGTDPNATTPVVVDADGELIQGAFGTLLLRFDGSYIYTLTDPSSGDSTTDVFTYNVEDDDGSTNSGLLTINIADDNPLAVADDGGSVDESALASGSGGGTLVAEGNLLINDTAGADGITISQVAGQAAANGIISVAVAAGTLLVYTTDEAANAAKTGEEAGYYIFTLENPVIEGAGDSLVFNYIIVDGDLDLASADLTILINDDAPAAKADADSLLEGTMTGGNVISGVDDDDLSGLVADIPGADGAVVSQVLGDALVLVSGDETEVRGAFGTLFMDADGDNRYEADDGLNGTVVDTFTYTLLDNDGDTSSADLVFTVSDANSPAGSSASASVREAALDGDAVAGFQPGSEEPNPGSPDETAGGLLGYSFGADGPSQSVNPFVWSTSAAALDGETAVALPSGLRSGGDLVIWEVSQDGLTLTGRVDPAGVGPYANQVVAVLTLIDPATGAYSFALMGPLDHPDAGETGAGDPIDLSFGYTLTDLDGTTDSGSLTITVEDDAAIAKADSDQGIENGADVTGNVLTGEGTAEGTANADVTGADGIALIRQVTHGLATFSLADAVSGVLTFTTDLGGSFSINLTGETGALGGLGGYSYSPPSVGDGDGGNVETFGYLAEDGDGDGTTSSLVIGIDPVALAPGATLAVSGAAALKEDTMGLLAFTATPQGDDAITHIEISGFPADWSLDLLSLGLDSGTVSNVTLSNGVLSFDVSGVAGAVSGSIAVTPGPANDDGDVLLTINATASDGSASSESQNDGNALIIVDAVVDGSEVSGAALAGVAVEGGQSVDLGLSIVLGSDSTTGIGPDFESQGGTDDDGSEKVTQVVVRLDVLGEIQVDLSAALSWDTTLGVVPVQAAGSGNEQIWTFDSSGLTFAQVQQLIASFQVAGPAFLTDTIVGNIETTTEETVLSGFEDDLSDNVDIDNYDFFVAVESRVIRAADLQVSTSNSGDPQTIQVTITEQAGEEFTSGTTEIAPGTAQEPIPLDFQPSLELDPDDSYTITIDYLGGNNTIDVTGLNLLDMMGGSVIFEVNPFAPPSDDFDFSIGLNGNNYEGGIFVLAPTADPSDFGFDVSLPVGYFFLDELGAVSSANPETTLLLDSTQSGNVDFTIDLADLVVDRFTVSSLDTIDISGNQRGGTPTGENNTLVLSAQALLDVTDNPDDGDDIFGLLTVMGDTGDSVSLVDQDGAGAFQWVQGTSAGGLTDYTYSDGIDTLATLQADDDLTVTGFVIV